MFSTFFTISPHLSFPLPLTFVREYYAVYSAFSLKQYVHIFICFDTMFPNHSDEKNTCKSFVSSILHPFIEYGRQTTLNISVTRVDQHAK